MDNQLLAPKNRTSLLALLVMCAMFLALISLFMPLVSVGFFGTWSWSAMDVLLEEAGDDEIRPFIAFCMAGSIVGGIFAAIGYKKVKLVLVSLIIAAANCVMMVAAMSEDIDYAAIGFYLFELMNLAALVMSIVGLYLNGKTQEEVVVQPTVVCASCGASMEAKAAFCAKCGAAAKKPESRMISCPKCSAAQPADAMFCSKCGSSLRGDVMPKTPSVTTPSTPTPTPTPTSTPTPAPTSTSTPASAKDKGDRKAVCPHCGARQSTENTNCKYCGTPMK